MTTTTESGPRASTADYALLGVAVLAVSTSAPLIRYAAAPALAIAFWRNLAAVPFLAPAARRSPRPTRREHRLIAVSGLLLAAHFATWIPSVSFTSVSSSVALVATQPVWSAMIARGRGEHVERGVWTGIGIALIGVVLLSGVDLSISTRAAFGDALALVGGALAAAYVTVGAEVRKTVDTARYASQCYSVAAAALLVMCLVGGQPLTGYGLGTWAAIGGLTLGAQLLGHTLINRVLRTISATAVSVSILFEIVGATILAALWFSETPPVAALPAAVAIGTGVIVVIRAGRTIPPEPIVA